MRHHNVNKIFGREKGPREMMLRNLASSVIMYEHVRTTETKAKVVRSLVEHAITIAKRGDLTARRELIALLPQKLAVKKLMEVLGKKYDGRNGGYLRLTKLHRRLGDNAQVVLIELL